MNVAEAGSSRMEAGSGGRSAERIEVCTFSSTCMHGGVATAWEGSRIQTRQLTDRARKEDPKWAIFLAMPRMAASEDCLVAG